MIQESWCPPNRLINSPSLTWATHTGRQVKMIINSFLLQFLFRDEREHADLLIHYLLPSAGPTWNAPQGGGGSAILPPTFIITIIAFIQKRPIQSSTEWLNSNKFQPVRTWNNGRFNQVNTNGPLARPDINSHELKALNSVKMWTNYQQINLWGSKKKKEKKRKKM